MHDSFFGFYPPNQQEYDRLWKEGLVVFDTNALLDLYRLPPTAREELFKALEYFQDRVWIPYQVGLEFQRNRFSVILDQKKLTAAALTEAEKLIAGLRGRINALKLDQHGIHFDPMPVLKKLDGPISDISDAIKKVQAAELDVSASDPIRERLDNIFEKRVGVGPQTQEELDELSKDADTRFAAKIPPGYADEKQKDGRTFIHDQLTYKNAFGDLVLWRQLLAHVKTNKIKCVMLITSDQKEDWWWKEGHKVIGPHQELMREIKRVAEVELFWMYTSDTFLKLSSTYRNQPVSEEAVAELSQLVQRVDAEREQTIEEFTNSLNKWVSHSREFSDNEKKWSARKRLGGAFQLRKNYMHPIMLWLASNRSGTFTQTEDILDYIGTRKNGQKIGYTVDYISLLLTDDNLPSRIVANMDKKVRSMRDNGLHGLGLIFVTEVEDILSNTHKFANLNSDVDVLLQVYDVKELIIGAIEANEFRPFYVIEHGD